MLKQTTYLFLLLFVALMLVFVLWDAPVEYITQFVSDNSVVSVLAFVFLMAISTIFAPITVIPMVPFVALLLGPFNTAIYSVIGWTIGSVVAFWISRNVGRPILVKLVPEDQIVKYHNYIPRDISFWWIVFLRMVIPVDILGYLIGLLTEVKIGKYFLATLIGVMPFSFIFAYGYDLILLKNKTLTVLVFVFAVAVIIINYFFYKNGKKHKEDSDNELVE